jgi:hypothetical protein
MQKFPAHFLIIDLENDIKKYKSKLGVITGNFFISNIDRLYLLETNLFIF